MSRRARRIDARFGGEAATAGIEAGTSRNATAANRAAIGATRGRASTSCIDSLE